VCNSPDGAANLCGVVVKNVENENIQWIPKFWKDPRYKDRKIRAECCERFEIVYSRFARRILPNGVCDLCPNDFR
jgi:hypothetical protein